MTNIGMFRINHSISLVSGSRVAIYNKEDAINPLSTITRSELRSEYKNKYRLSNTSCSAEVYLQRLHTLNNYTNVINVEDCVC